MLIQTYFDTGTVRQILRDEKAAQAENDFKRFVAKKSKNYAKNRKGKKKR